MKKLLKGLLNLNELDSFRDYHYKQELYNAFIVGIKYQQKISYSEEEMLAFGKSCFYKGFEKAEKDDANCYTVFREEIGSIIEQFKNK